MKCKDIPDRPILEFLATRQGKWSLHWGRPEGYGKDDWPTIADAMPPGLPEKLYLAKMRQLLRREVVIGCDCGCRGDWEITDKGLAEIGQPRVKEMIG